MIGIVHRTHFETFKNNFHTSSFENLFTYPIDIDWSFVRLYEDAAHKLNMKSLLNFLSELCRCSSLQLSSFNRKTSTPSNGASDYSTLPTNALHLYRLGDIMSKCVGSDRPLLHIMRAWSVVSQHLVEVRTLFLWHMIESLVFGPVAEIL